MELKGFIIHWISWAMTSFAALFISLLYAWSTKVFTPARQIQATIAVVHQAKQFASLLDVSNAFLYLWPSVLHGSKGWWFEAVRSQTRECLKLSLFSRCVHSRLSRVSQAYKYKMNNSESYNGDKKICPHILIYCRIFAIPLSMTKSNLFPKGKALGTRLGEISRVWTTLVNYPWKPRVWIGVFRGLKTVVYCSFSPQVQRADISQQRAKEFPLKNSLMQAWNARHCPGLMGVTAGIQLICHGAIKTRHYGTTPSIQ